MNKEPETCIDRRDCLKIAGAGVGASLAGCLSSGLTGSGPKTYLSERKDVVRSEDLDYPYPIYGEKLPSASVEAPLKDTKIQVDGFDTDLLLTFFYSHCQTQCPRLTSTLRNVQAHSVENGYASEVSFAEITFDPARDTEERLRKYADKMNINLEVDNWYFLRPKSEKEAKKIVEDKFGINFNKTNPEGMDRYMFNHLSRILLINKKGYVERVYRLAGLEWQEVRDDVQKLREKEP